MKRTMIYGLLCCLFFSSLIAQGTDLEDKTRAIRIKKIASEWKGAILTLHTRDENELTGKLKDVTHAAFILERHGREVEIPLGEVVKVSFKPGAPELFLTIASAIMGGGFLSGALLISDEDTSPAALALATTLGIGAGGLWGFSTFYETEVIELE